jgi:hypothetical protein
VKLSFFQGEWKPGVIEEAEAAAKGKEASYKVKLFDGLRRRANQNVV